LRHSPLEHGSRSSLRVRADRRRHRRNRTRHGLRAGRRTPASTASLSVQRFTTQLEPPDRKLAATRGRAPPRVSRFPQERDVCVEAKRSAWKSRWASATSSCWGLCRSHHRAVGPPNMGEQVGSSRPLPQPSVGHRRAPPAVPAPPWPQAVVAREAPSGWMRASSGRRAAGHRRGINSRRSVCAVGALLARVLAGSYSLTPSWRVLGWVLVLAMALGTKDGGCEKDGGGRIPAAAPVVEALSAVARGPLRSMVSASPFSRPRICWPSRKGGIRHGAAEDLAQAQAPLHRQPRNSARVHRHVHPTVIVTPGKSCRLPGGVSTFHKAALAAFPQLPPSNGWARIRSFGERKSG